MKVISSIGNMHGEISGYNYEKFRGIVDGYGNKNIFITYLSEEKYKNNKNSYKEIHSLEGKYNLFFNGIDFNYYSSLREKYSIKAIDAETITKKNLLDMLDSITKSYLEGFWKDENAINSELTDNVFRAKHKFILSLNPEYEEKYWIPLHEEIYDNLKKYNKNFIILSDVESSFFFREKINM